MGLLDSVLGALGQGGARNPLLDSVLALVNDPAHGGLEGLVHSFQERGLGGIVDSWVSTGKNLPISADQLTQGLGPEQLGAIAQKLGMSQGEVSTKLAELLPDVVDKLTPGGQVPEAGSLGDLIGAFTKRSG